MAGPFGFEEGQKHDVSVARAEQGLMPAVRRAPPDALIIADGFSCREQISDLSDRRPLHLAEAIRLVQQSRDADGAGAPEDEWRGLVAGDLAHPTSPLRGAAVLGGAAMLGVAALMALAAGTRSRRS